VTTHPDHDAGTARLLGGPVAKHAQLRDLLVDAVRGLRPGDAIPSERALMGTYDVSRSTVRTAIDALIAEGLLERAQGKGTFVARPRLGSRLHLASFTQDMARRGVRPTTRVVSVRVETPADDVARALGLAEGEQAWHLVRLRLADDTPMALEDGWYPQALLPGLDAHDLAGSLYDLLATRYGTVIDAAAQVVWADSADADRAALLAVPSGAPLMVFQRTSTAADTPVEHVVSAYRGDRYQLHMSLTRSMLD